MEIHVASVYFDVDKLRWTVTQDAVIYSGSTLDEIVPHIKEIGKAKLAEIATRIGKGLARIGVGRASGGGRSLLRALNSTSAFK